MAWTNSKIFRAYLADSLCRTAPFDLNADAFKVALFNNSITPDQNAASANTAYNAGQWATANEIWQAGQWAQGGASLAGVVVDSATAGVVFLDATDTASGAAATLNGFFGCQVYDDTVAAPVADQGVCYNYFGGSQTVTAGQATVVWNVNGVKRWTFSRENASQYLYAVSSTTGPIGRAVRKSKSVPSTGSRPRGIDRSSVSSQVSAGSRRVAPSTSPGPAARYGWAPRPTGAGSPDRLTTVRVTASPASSSRYAAEQSSRHG